MTFPIHFIWGAATSAYQIEGAAREDGRGPSIWDIFCRTPGAIWQDADADNACNHYHLYRQDVNLMKELGLQAYRFSIAWPRVLPRGRGAINTAGLDFYDRLTDELLAAGITPYVTLYHWDYPLELYKQGGWLQPESAQWFADYGAVIVDRLSDRISNWFTFNEPQIFIGMGYQDGSHAPGDRLQFSKVLMIGHHVLLAHGMAVQMIRSRSKVKACIGYALAPNPVAVPASTRREDIQAAQEVFFSITRKDCMNNAWWTDPVVLGRYPYNGLRLFEKDLPHIGRDDMKTICQPLDFLGLNVYFGKQYRAGADGSPEEVPFSSDQAYTSFKWPVVPASIYWAAKFYFDRYTLPLIISENGMANNDVHGTDSAVHDAERIDFLRRYLCELKRACMDGVDVRGYFLWSLMDNFEWAAGYSQRFGIVYVDYSTQQRILKDSASWYAEVISSNGSMV